MKKIGTFFINSLVAAGLVPSTDVLASMPNTDGLHDKKIDKIWKFEKPRSITLAGHRSHSSHGSHGSHGSHRSSSGGGYTPRSTPHYVSPPVKNYNTAPTTSPSQSGSDSTASSSILPLSPATSPTVTKINGNNKTFKVLVMQVQLAMYANGYYNGTVDGIAGSETSAAISKYELKNGLPVTGRLSDSLLDNLNIDTDSILKP